jgi:hypothetical protein
MCAYTLVCTHERVCIYTCAHRHTQDPNTPVHMKACICLLRHTHTCNRDHVASCSDSKGNSSSPSACIRDLYTNSSKRLARWVREGSYTTRSRIIPTVLISRMSWKTSDFECLKAHIHMCVCVYIYTHTYAHTVYIHVHIHTPTHIHKYVRIYTQMPTYIYAWIHTYACICIHTQIECVESAHEWRQVAGADYSRATCRLGGKLTCWLCSWCCGVSVGRSVTSDAGTGYAPSFS